MTVGVRRGNGNPSSPAPPGKLSIYNKGSTTSKNNNITMLPVNTFVHRPGMTPPPSIKNKVAVSSSKF